MIEALQAEGLRPLPVFAYSLKDGDSIKAIGDVFAAVQPAVVVNSTGFAVSAPAADRKPTVLESTGAVVLQAIFEFFPTAMNLPLQYFTLSTSIRSPALHMAQLRQ